MARPIRRAVPADGNLIAELVRSAYRPWVPVVGGRPAPMDADYFGLIAAGRVYVADAESGAGPAGVIVLVPEPDVLLVENVAVRPRLQGRGVGRRLLAFAEDEAHRLGLSAVRLYTHERMTGNIALYERLGYTRTGWEPIGHGEHLVHLRKGLPTRPAD